MKAMDWRWEDSFKGDLIGGWEKVIGDWEKVIGDWEKVIGGWSAPMDTWTQPHIPYMELDFDGETRAVYRGEAPPLPERARVLKLALAVLQ